MSASNKPTIPLGIQGIVAALLMAQLACAPTAPATEVAQLSGAPTNVKAILSGVQVTVSWTAPSHLGTNGVTNYTVTTTPGGTTSTTTGPVTTLAIPHLWPGTYTFSVHANNAAGAGPESLPSNPITILAAGIVPGAPSNVSATPGNAQATVTWMAPTSNGNSPIENYTVTSDPGGITVTSAGTSAVVTGLTNGTSYTFTVFATNAAGNGPPSDPSSPVTPATVPDAPTDVIATASTGQAQISWTAPDTNGGSAILTYTVTASPGGAHMTTPDSGTTLLFTNLDTETAYTFTVHATNAIGDGPESLPSNIVIPDGLPGAPTITSVTPGNADITITWSAPVSDGGSPIISYTVETTPEGSSTPVSILSIIGTTTVVSGLTNGQAYTLQVAATNAVGTGPWSVASSEVTPVTVPGAPTGVTATAGDGSATVSWTAPASFGGTLIIGSYTVTAYPGGAQQTISGTNTVSAATQLTFPSLTDGITYTFTVHATNFAGNGPESAPSNSVTPGGVPGAPTIISVTAGDGQVTISWDAPSDGGSAILSYTVETLPAGTTTSVTGTTAIITGLTNGQSYTFEVAATNTIGTGPWSTVSSPAVTPLTVPGAPTGVLAVAGDASATVSWTAPTDLGGATQISSYTVTAYPSLATQSVSGATTLIFGALTNGTTYTFTVHATTSAGSGLESAPSNAVTPELIASTATSTLVASPGSLVADGHSQSILTLTLLNASSLPIPNEAVVLSVSGSNNVLYPISGQTNASGQFVATLTSTRPETKVATASVDTLKVTTDVTFTAATCTSTTPNFTATVITQPAADGTLTAGDFKGSGVLDALVTEQGADDIIVSLGNGNGTFQSPTTYQYQAGPTFAAVGDFDNDGKLDAVVTNETYDTVSWFPGNGDGTFGAPSYFPAGTSPGYLLAADFNNDGNLDIVTIIIVGSPTVYYVSVLLGRGDGSFEEPVLTETSKGATKMVVGDFNGDGIPDVATSEYYSGSNNGMAVLLGKGDGTFQTAVNYPVADGNEVAGIATGDFDNNGTLDIAVVENPNKATELIDVFPGEVDGTFETAVTSTSSDINPGDLRSGDFNGDGNVDLVVSDLFHNQVWFLAGKGTGGFLAPVAYTLSGSTTNSAGLFVGDFTGDGRLDVLVANSSQSYFTLLTNNCAP